MEKADATKEIKYELGKWMFRAPRATGPAVESHHSGRSEPKFRVESH